MPRHVLPLPVLAKKKKKQTECQTECQTFAWPPDVKTVVSTLNPNRRTKFPRSSKRGVGGVEGEGGRGGGVNGSAPSFSPLPDRVWSSESLTPPQPLFKRRLSITPSAARLSRSDSAKARALLKASEELGRICHACLALTCRTRGTPLAFALVSCCSLDGQQAREVRGRENQR